MAFLGDAILAPSSSMTAFVTPSSVSNSVNAAAIRPENRLKKGTEGLLDIDQGWPSVKGRRTPAESPTAASQPNR